MKLAVVFCVSTAIGMAQPAFEVASIKPTPPDRQNRLRTDYCAKDGSFSTGGTPVFWSLEYAFQLQDYQISGEPEWLHDFASTYDIEAKPLKLATNAECRQMLQALFVERFKLASHRESKEMPVYLLVAAKGGSKLKAGGEVRLNGGVMYDDDKPSFPNGWKMGQLASYLSDFAGRPVVDRTELPATYGITLDFSRNDTDGKPSVFTAVQEQLGLRLESGKAPIEVMMIDHIEKPSGN
jgi:uncharacterized protein (TIGR03435 family)